MRTDGGSGALARRPARALRTSSGPGSTQATGGATVGGADAGWSGATASVREFDSLPEPALRYIARLSELVGAEIGLVSTGPDRAETILRRNSALASWFDSPL